MKLEDVVNRDDVPPDVKAWMLEYANNCAKVECLNDNLQLILDSTEEGIFGLDIEGRHTFINPAGAKMLGFEVGELIGVGSHATWHHRYREGGVYQLEDCPIHKTLALAKRHDGEECFFRKDGTSFLVEFASTPMIERGEVVGAVVVFRDITKRKQLEFALIEIENLRVISDLSMSLAHSFNGDMQIMRSNLDLLFLDVSIPDKYLCRVEDINNVFERMTAGIRQLRTHVTARRDNDYSQNIDMNQLLVDVVDQTRTLWRSWAGREEAYILVDLRLEQTRSVSGSLNQFKLVFYGLLKNAIEAMPNGGRISIATGIDGNNVFVHITDTGVGMDEEGQMKFFQPFHSTKKEIRYGQGLSMSTAQVIIRSYGGDMRIVETAPGKGMTIEVSLPW